MAICMSVSRKMQFVLHRRGKMLFTTYDEGGCTKSL